MFRVRTFGGLSVVEEGSDGGPVVVQRRRLALLALVAAAGERGISRERIMAYLWPESGIANARNNLKQAVFALRQQFGADLFAGGHELRLRSAVMHSDRAEFESALADDRVDDALKLCSGPFLDGFHLDGAAEFERWVDSERDVTVRRLRSALEAAAVRTDEEAHVDASVKRWQQLVSLDPFSSRYTVGLMRALAAAGDAPGAIRAARAHEVRVRDELDAAVDPAVVAWVERLKKEMGEVEHAGRSIEHQASRVFVPPGHRTARTESGDPASAYQSARRRRRFGIGVALACGVVLGAAALYGAVRYGEESSAEPWATAPPAANVVAVLPFSVYAADRDSSYLGRGLAELLSQDLDGAGELRSIDPRVLGAYGSRRGGQPPGPDSARTIARRLSAGTFVLGEATRSGRILRVSARMYLPGDSLTPTASAQVEGDSLQLLQLVDRLAAELLGQSGSDRIDGLDVLAARTTASLAALKAYLRGEAYFADARFPRAVEMFQRAVTIDSGFALAYFRLSESTDWTGEGARSLEAAERAYALRGKLSKQSRLLVEGFRSWRVGDIGRAERSYRELLRWNPASIEARYQLGEVRFHNNPSLGRSVLEAWAPFEQVLAVNPDDRYALAHLMRLAALARDTAAVDSITRKLAVLEPPGESRSSVALLRAAAIGDADARARALSRLSDASDKLLIDSFERIAVYAGDLDAADGIARLLSEGKHAPENRALGRLYGAAIARARGRWVGARNELRSASDVAPEEGLYAWAFLAAMPNAPVPREELQWLRDSVEQSRVGEPGPRAPVDNLRFTSFRPVSRLYILGLLDIRLGDTTAAKDAAEAVEVIAQPGGLRGASAVGRVGDVDALTEDARSVASALRGMIAASGGRHDEAIRLLRGARPVLPLEFLASYLGARSIERYTLAGELEAAGRREEARRWRDAMAERFWFEVVLRRARR